MKECEVANIHDARQLIFMENVMTPIPCNEGMRGS
jgi:hypothetical protein